MILFTADWHLKLGQRNVPREWARARYRKFFKQIHSIDCSLHIIGGDLFDRTPSMEELELYFEFIAGVQVKTLIYDGNHCATKKNHTFLSRLKDVTASINPLVTIVDDIIEYAGFSILPYCRLHAKDSIRDLDTDKPLFTHVRGEIPPHVKPEVDLELFKEFPVVFAGDLHSHSNTQRNIVYPGSPMTTTFHRTKVSTGYIIIHTESAEIWKDVCGVWDASWSWEWHELDLPQLIRKTVTNPKDMVATKYHHTIYELEGDMQELASVANSDLLDKKIIQRNSEATLVMSKDMTIEQELVEYLTYILEFPTTQINNIVGTYHDFAQKADLE